MGSSCRRDTCPCSTSSCTTTNHRTDEYGGTIENRSRFLFEVLDAVLEVWPSQRVGVKHGPMMNELGAFKAVDSTLAVSEYVYEKLGRGQAYSSSLT